MRKGSALIVAGIVTVIAGLAGPGIAADDDLVSPDSAAEAVEDPAGDDPAPVEEAGSTDLGSEEGRAPGEVDTEEVGAQEDGRRERGQGRERDRDEDGRETKQPLANVDVKMQDIEFKPKTVTISTGDEITWRNYDTAQHDARADDGEFETPLLEKGETAQVPFNSEGTFSYFCSVHPSMTGKVIVRSSGGGGSDGDSSSGDVGGTGGTGGTFDGSTGTDSSGSSGTFGSSGSSGSTGGGSLPDTGGVELPLLLFGSALIVVGLLARAFHEYWIWR